MSGWGPGLFENDDAADLMAELERNPDGELVARALSEATDPATVGYLEIPEGATAVAAAELLAQIFGKPGATPVVQHELLGEAAFSSLVREIQSLDAGAKEHLTRRALTVADRVLNDQENSELRQVYEDKEAWFSAWKGAMEDLLTRLNDVAASLKRGGSDERRG